MTYLDLGLLNLIERACRAFQRLTGKTNVWVGVQLTNLSIVIFFAWAAMYAWGTNLTEQIMVALFCTGLLYLLTQTVFKEPIEASENNAYRRVSKGYRNPRRVRDAPLRIAFLTLSVVMSYPVALAYFSIRLHVILLSYVLIVLTTIVLYVLACDPQPPCAGRLRFWARKPALTPLSAVPERAGERRPAVRTGRSIAN
jgi:hypothetical protein